MKIASKHKFKSGGQIIGPHGLVVHAISEYIHRSGLKSYNGYDKQTDTYKGIKISDYDEWLKYDHWLSLIDLSVHTCVDTQANIIRCVEDNKIAYHAGKSTYSKYEGLNKSFLGCEVVMPGKNDYTEFTRKLNHDFWVTNEQYKALAIVIKESKVDLIIGHDQCAGDDVRGKGLGKLDPGALFNWDKLRYYISQA